MVRTFQEAMRKRQVLRQFQEEASNEHAWTAPQERLEKRGPVWYFISLIPHRKRWHRLRRWLAFAMQRKR